MTEVKFIPPELLQAVKNIPIENVIEKIFNEDNKELGGETRHKEDRSGGRFEIYKNDKYTFFINPFENNVTIKDNITDKTWIGNADTIGLVQRAKYWDFWDSNNKKPTNMKEMFKKSVLWLAFEFDLIKDIKDGKIELDLKEIQAIKKESEQIKNDYLYKMELQMEKLKTGIESFKAKKSLEFKKKGFRGVDKNLMELLAKEGVCKYVKNSDKGNREELKIAMRNYDGEIEDVQSLYYNVFTKKWDKRNIAKGQISWFGNKQAENVVITESFMDSASVAQTIATLKNMDYAEVLDNYLFISINGELGNLKKETIKQFLGQNTVKKVVLSHDSDKKGEIYDKMYLKNGEFHELVKDKNLVVFKPKDVKDFNDFIRTDNFKTGNFRDSLIMEKAENYYKEYLREMEIEKALEKEAVSEYDPGEEAEGERMANAEVGQNVVDVVESAKSSNSPTLSGNVKMSEILEDLMESKAVNDKTNYFYKIDGESIKFAKFTAKMKGVTKKGIYGVFFKENDFIEVDKNGKEKGTGVSILYGKDVESRRDIKNIVFTTSITDGLKLLKAKEANIRNSVIIGIKSASVETKILYEELVEHFFTGGNSLSIKNVFIVGNDKKNGQFLESLLNHENWYYRLSDLVWKDTDIEVYDENDLKNIELKMDIFDTAPGKSIERGNPKKEKESVLSV